MYKFIRASKKVILTIIMFLIALSFLIPIVITITNSFMSEDEIYLNYQSISSVQFLGTENYINEFANLKLIPDEIVLSQYYQVLIKRIEFMFFFWNSVKIVVPIILGQLIVSAMAAYGFAKFRFKYRDKLFFVYIVTMLMPYQVTLVPNYLVLDKLGLIGSYASIILPGVFTTFGVFLLRQFMMYIPDQYIHAAKVDGAGHFTIFTKIIVPMSMAGIASLAILLLIDNWNMVEQPIVFLRALEDFPLSVVLSEINSKEIGISFAASSLYMAPILLVFLYGENYFIEGLQLSGLKG